MTPEVKLFLVEQEIERFQRDVGPAWMREAVHVDRLRRILRLDFRVNTPGLP